MTHTAHHNMREPVTYGLHAPVRRWLLLLAMPFLLAFDSKPVIRHFSPVATYHFVAYRGDKEIGWLKATRSQHHHRQIMGTDIQLNFSMVLEFDARATTLNEYAGQHLQLATVVRTLDKEVKLDNAISWRGSHYDLVSLKETQQRKAPIHHTVTSMYFAEPRGVGEIFSEVYLQNLKVESVGQGIYETKLPKGGKMTYFYQGGKLIRVKSQTQYGQVVFERKSP